MNAAWGRRTAVVMAGTLGLFAPGAARAAEPESAPANMADELETLRRSQKEMQERLDRQQRRIEELESRERSSGSSAAAPSGGDLASELDRYLKAGNLTKSGKSLLKFYGFLRLDAMWSDSRGNNTQTFGWVLPEDSTTAGAAKSNAANFTMHPRLTRFGFDLDAGRVESLDANVTGKMEIDFYNSGLAGQAESRAAIRMRHAYVNLDWGKTSLLAGQTSELISPLFPSANPDLVMWGAGNLGDRRAQVRLTQKETIGDGTLTAAGAVGLAGAIDNQNLDANAFRDGETSGIPALQTRIAYAFPFRGGKAEIGAWGHYAEEHTDSPIPATSSHRDFTSSAVGFDLKAPLVDRFSLMGECWMGRNLDDVRGGIFQGVNTLTGGEIGSRGWWAEVGYKATDTWSLHTGYTIDNPRNGDVAPGGRVENSAWYIGSRWNFDPVEVGIDLMRWRTEYDSMSNGNANRVQAFISYKF